MRDTYQSEGSSRRGSKSVIAKSHRETPQKQQNFDSLPSIHNTQAKRNSNLLLVDRKKSQSIVSKKNNTNIDVSNPASQAEQLPLIDVRRDTLEENKITAKEISQQIDKKVLQFDDETERTEFKN